jgi:hypothetical protein
LWRYEAVPYDPGPIVTDQFEALTLRFAEIVSVAGFDDDVESRRCDLDKFGFEGGNLMIGDVDAKDPGEFPREARHVTFLPVPDMVPARSKRVH